jgi:putative transposase
MKSSTYYQRHLLHYQPRDATFLVTIRLDGSLPPTVIEQLRQEMEVFDRRLAGIRNLTRRWDEYSSFRQEYFEKFEALLDGTTRGPTWLRNPSIADLVTEVIRYRDRTAYDLLAYCVMPNHVHILFTPLNTEAPDVVGRPDWSTYNVTAILSSLKWYTAVQANRILERTGSFWQHESYDHVIRDSKDLERLLWYTLLNPVKAGLAMAWREWRWTYCRSGLVPDGAAS